MKILSALLITASLMLGGASAAAQKASDFDAYSATIEENINHPSVSNKHAVTVSEAMAPLARTLRKAGFATATTRADQVVVVTIPCSDLFAPNATELKPGAKAILEKLKPYMKRTDNYKVLIAVHADNTGDATYADRLTSDRATAVDEYFYHDAGNEETGFIPYGLGADEPVASNIGVNNRARNRRVEIYFVPTQGFIDKARKNKGV